MFLAQLSHRSKVAIGTDPLVLISDVQTKIFVNKVDNKNKTTVLE